MNNRIFELADKKGIKMQYLAKALGVKGSRVYDWKREKSSPSKSEIYELSNILNTTESYLRGEVDDPHPDEKKPTIFNGQPASIEIAELWEEIEDLDDEEAIKTLEHVRLLKLRRKL